MNLLVVLWRIYKVYNRDEIERNKQGMDEILGKEDIFGMNYIEHYSKEQRKEISSSILYNVPR